ncbi:tudor domain-containing protein 3-like [Patiria miniata]|uniref:Survival of motor neuron-related-splicing factor 30 n=1 Tax=Patiria miniata TaxID=46514 RepID=A0A913ZVQ9_PATMI|nr:tudor domain-containing protein 3-like [Patiria miniata]
MVEANLLNQGWHLSKEGLERCKNDVSDSRVEAVVRKAMDIDLRHIAVAAIPTDITKGKMDKMQGPMVLQVQKIRNISAPKANEDSGAAPPLLRIQLTDGHTMVMALVLNSITKIDLSTPPGSKLKLMGSVACNHGFLLLAANNCTFLGGHVEELVQRWELAKSLYHHTRAAVSGSGGPPPWVPFGQRNRHGEASEKPTKITLKKSLEDPKPKEQTEQDKEFAEQRKAAIQEVNKSKQGQGKTFGGTKATPALHARDSREPARKGYENNRRDSGRNARRDEQGPPEGKTRAEGIYRDLDYGGYQPSDRDIQQLVNMGFKRDAASNALRKNTGNADAAVEMLLKESDSSQPQAQNFGRQRPDTRPERNRGNERRGRRGGDDEEEASAPPAGPATLFDFLQPKLGKDSEKGSQSTAEVTTRKDMGRSRDFSKEQPSSVREAGISFVHDGQTSNYKQREQQQGRQQRDNNMDRGRRNYEEKSGPRRAESNSARNYAGNEGRGRNQDRGYGNKENSNFRDRNSGQDRRHDNTQGNSYPQRRDDTRGEDHRYSESRANNKSQGFQRESNFKPRDLQDNRPPRFQKQNNSQLTQKDKVPYDRPKSNTDREGNQRGGNQFQPAQSVDSSAGFKGPGPSAQQRQFQKQNNSQIPQKDKVPYDRPKSNTDSQGNQRDGNQFQPAQSFDSSAGFKGPGPSAQQRPILNPGDQCQAKYWEDNQFYNAVLTAIHPSGKTCVVLFPEYGNHEEVKMTDIRPLASQALANPSSFAPGPSAPSLMMSGKGGMFEGSTATHLEFRQGGEGTAYNRPRQQREPRKNVRPAQNFYQPPSSRK